MTRPYHQVPPKPHKMSVGDALDMDDMTLTKEESTYQTMFAMAMHANEFLDFVGQLTTMSENTRAEMKKAVILYNLLKKFWDADDVLSYKKLFCNSIKKHLPQIKIICILGTMRVDLSATMEKLEERTDMCEGSYLLCTNHLKALYDLRQSCGYSQALEGSL